MLWAGWYKMALDSLRAATKKGKKIGIKTVSHLSCLDLKQNFLHSGQ
jgi:hypothetical protein